MKDKNGNNLSADLLECCFKKAVDSIGMIWEITGLEMRHCRARLSYGNLLKGALCSDNRIVISMAIRPNGSVGLSCLKNSHEKVSGKENIFGDFIKNFRRALAQEDLS
ncbi:MAG: hypothetical protein PHH24_01215 [Candidatus Moranbacteria bacterium]|jgi:hypothetical protein|nr:hypothetical protein [Candidatus Moranbacteria bacterium]MDD5652508.1 hypothetical protein [Candidatus Moranbacteria bacterium]MDX9855310.1 hypothetical protein [Candidatus Moranbacteria bacterium]